MEKTSFFDTSVSMQFAVVWRIFGHILLYLYPIWQDPYIRLTLHDGRYNEGGIHVGESFRTTTKDNAGGNATYNEKFIINKPGSEHKYLIMSHKFETLFSENMNVLRVQLYDANVTLDSLLGLWVTFRPVSDSRNP